MHHVLRAHRTERGAKYKRLITEDIPHTGHQLVLTSSVKHPAVWRRIWAAGFETFCCWGLLDKKSWYITNKTLSIDPPCVFATVLHRGGSGLPFGSEHRGSQSKTEPWTGLVNPGLHSLQLKTNQICAVQQGLGVFIQKLISVRSGRGLRPASSPCVPTTQPVIIPL